MAGQTIRGQLTELLRNKAIPSDKLNEFRLFARSVDSRDAFVDEAILIELSCEDVLKERGIEAKRRRLAHD